MSKSTTEISTALKEQKTESKNPIMPIEGNTQEKIMAPLFSSKKSDADRRAMDDDNSEARMEERRFMRSKIPYTIGR